ncbi:hypothetical protein Cob_v002287 [Colletotrichum orbiculare MAFF 240422]|uniref:Uncharacterized protein n=1 Tax=Colletotrichum orbiculare (strain 104-T / ATCC 96160 / CBS 514.97 / LARS 414 / MAFF 240422) TaxID=1213857 RepID=N4V9G2_COLOR|nr:hypothetical protein Cob_v002287 [Colletotrichum orbiculare MAFF 240422]
MASTAHPWLRPSFRLLLSWLILHGVLAGATPTPGAIGPHEDDFLSLPIAHGALAKRARKQFKEFPPHYEGRIDKGRFLLSLFGLSEEQAKSENEDRDVASPWQDPKAVEQWGWTRTLKRPPFYDYEEDAPESVLDLVPGFGFSLNKAFNDPDHEIDGDDNVLSSYKHNGPFKLPNGDAGRSTNAMYNNVLNPKAGAVIFDRNFSPRYKTTIKKVQGDVPELEILSDIIYFQWLEVCAQEDVSPDKINVIFRAHVTYAPTFQLVMRTLKEKGLESIPGWRDKVVFPMDTDQGLAILGSVHGAGAALFLIQHKERFGLKKITEVTVWGDYNEPGLENDPEKAFLNLRFTVTDA